MKILSTENFGMSRCKILLYGPSGSGKTFSFKTLPPAKTLIISAEAGLLPLASSKIDVIDITQNDKGETLSKEARIQKLGEVFKFLNTKEAIDKYSWVGIDSLTEISENLVEILAQEFSDRKDALVLWGEYSKRIRGIIKNFRDLPHYNIIMTALATPSKSDPNVMAVDLNGKIASRVPQYFDEVFFIQLIDDKDGRKAILHTQSTAKAFAKDRSGMLGATEPADLTAILNKIQKGNIQ